MKTILAFRMELLFLILIAFNSSASETNLAILDKPYEKLSQAVVKNVEEQQLTLVRMRNVDRATMTKLWMQLINQIARCRVIDFDPVSPENIVSANLAPPQGKGYMSGMSPAAITNAEDRKAYEEVLRINRDKSLRVNLERSLQELDGSCNYYVLIYIRQAYKPNAADAKELAGFIDSIEDENHRAELRKNLKNILDANK